MSIHWGGRGAGHVSRWGQSATNEPSLSLNFLTPPLDPRITFTRGSNATLVDSTGKITYAPANLLLYTQEFDNGAWLKINTTVTANTTVAPDGTSTADTLTASAGAGAHFMRQLATVTASTAYAFSFYVKAGTHNFIQLINTGDAQAFANFDLANGVVGTAGTKSTASITSTGNGWYRCTVVFDDTAALSNDQRIYLTSSASAAFSQSWTTAGTETVFIWGAQLEPVTYQTTAGPYVATTTAAYYGPRFDYDPVTLAPKGLLIEEQRTNLLLRSEEFDNAGWAKVNATITADATVSPDGTTNADKLVETTTATVAHEVTQSSSFVSGTSYTISIYAKAGERTFVRLGFPSNAFGSGNSAFFNLTAGSVGTIGAGAPTTSITPVGNGWYRCTMTKAANASAAGSSTILVSTADNTLTYTGDGTSGIFIWGAQLEAGAFATSYIPTVASQVTRAADQCSIVAPNFSDWYNASEGTFFFRGSTQLGATRHFLNGQTTNDRFLSSSAAGSTGITDLTNSATGGIIAANTTFNATVSYGASGLAASLNGGASGTSAYSGVFASVNQLQIGRRGALYMVGHIEKILYWPVRLSDAQLQALST